MSSTITPSLLDVDLSDDPSFGVLHATHPALPRAHSQYSELTEIGERERIIN